MLVLMLGAALALLPLAIVAASDLQEARQEECDIPVVPARVGRLPSAPQTQPWGWAEAMGLSRSTWQKATGGSKAVSIELRQLVWRGIVDYGKDYIRGPPTQLNAAADKLTTIWRAVQSIFHVPAIAEMFGNALVVEAVPLYSLLAPLPKGLSGAVFWREVETMRSLLRGFGMEGLRNQSSRVQRCFNGLSGPQDGLTPDDLCQACVKFFHCQRAEDGAYRLIRASFRSCLEIPKELTSGLVPSEFVRILDLTGSSCLLPSNLDALTRAFPKLRVLRMVDDDGLLSTWPNLLDGAGVWWGTLQGLELSIPSSVPAWVCKLGDLRHLQISPSPRGSIRALPDCLGNLTRLVDLNLVGNNLTGTASLPPALGKLQELRTFDAFENGRYSDLDAVCPDVHVPQRGGCVPGYVARADGTEPVWRCPDAGWKIQLEDRSIPWWRWRNIEKLHIDANFIQGHIPDDLPDFWPHLRSLDLHDMQLKGPLPRSLSRLKNLSQLQVQLNDLECGLGQEDAVEKLFLLPKMHSLNLDLNPRLCGCAPIETRAGMFAQIGETQIMVGCGMWAEL